MFSFQGASLNLSRDSMKHQITLLFQSISLVESTGIEPVTSCLQGRRSPSWANPPNFQLKVKSWKLTVHNFQLSIFNFQLLRSGGPGLAFLRESHAGCNSPPDCCQEPAFESILACVLVVLSRPGLNPSFSFFKKWWAKMDSNHRPHDYQSCALASWAIGPYKLSTSFLRYILLYPLNWITLLPNFLLPLYWP